MVRISSSSMGRSLALVLLIGLGILTPLEALTGEDEADRSRQTSPAEGEDSEPEGEDSEPEAKEPESEFELIRTPFGTIRRPKSETRPASPQATPAPAREAAPEAAADSPADPQAAPAQAGEEAADPAGEAPADPAGDAPETAPEAAGGQPSPSPPAGDTAVGFNCVQCSLAEFVRRLAGELELNYVLDPGVQGTVTIHTYGRMRRSDLRSLLETVLEINGAAMVRQGAVYRILPSQNARQLPLQVRRGPGSAGERVLQVVPLNFVPAAEMSELLTPYLSSGGDITYHQGANFLILSDTPANLDKLLELIRVFDAEVFGDKRVRIYSLEHSRATGLALELGGIFAGVAAAEASPIRFLPIPRLNSLLAIASGEAGFAEVDRWVARLDQAGQNREIRNYFVKVQNGDAIEIARLLRQVYEGRRRTAEDPLDPGGEPGRDPLAGPAAPGEEPEDRDRQDIRIVADPQNNALILQCSPQDFELIQETIRELDRVPRQVLINVKIYEVVLTDELSLGVSAFLQDRNRPTVPSPSATTASFGVAAGLSLATRALMGDTRELVAFLNAAETRSRSRVLSAPTVIASDNVVANIQVGSSIPTLSSQGLIPGGTGGGSLFSNTINHRNTGVILSVTPRINAGGWVTLAVRQEVSSPGPPPTAGIQSPTINIRSVETQVTVRNGQTIAIGGIISETKGKSRKRVPLLGSIPGLGLLFGTTSRTSERTELIALITPQVIEDIEQAADLTEELKSTLKGLKKELSRDES